MADAHWFQLAWNPPGIDSLPFLFNRVIELALNGPNRIGTIDAERVLGNFLIKDSDFKDL